jgi:penicillin-binding protein-related factor A (putative recombinase)
MFLVEKEFKKVNEHYRNNYFSKEIDARIKEKVHHEIERAVLTQPKKKQIHRLIKKISYITAACLVLFGLFIGSAFVSPAMSTMASKIPFLNKIFDQKPIIDVLREILEEKGYSILMVGYSSTQGKTYTVRVKSSEESFNQVKEEIKKITTDVISSRGYDDFIVDVEQEPIKPEVEQEPIKPEVDTTKPKYANAEPAFDVLHKVVRRLQEQGYKIHGKGGRSDAKVVSFVLEIEDTEKRTDEIEKAILEGIKKEGLKKEVTFKFRTFNVQEKEFESKWNRSVQSVISEGLLSKKEYKTKGVWNTYKKGTMNIFIETTIDKSDSEAPKLANKIEKEIDKFLQSNDIKDIVGDTPYTIVVQDKKGKKIK